MAYIRFTAKSRSLMSLATVSYLGRIDFNARAREKHNLESYKHCVLFYDQKPKKIGISLTNDSSEDSVLSLKHTPNGTMISGKRFLDYFDIRPAKTTTYHVTQDSDGLVVINLKKVHHQTKRTVYQKRKKRTGGSVETSDISSDTPS
jgi:hypothetical protein